MADYQLDSCVEEELMVIWRFIAKGNPASATRVVEAAYETFAVLASMPGIGRLGRFSEPYFEGVRSWPVIGFGNYLVLYRTVAGGIQVHHIIHSARNIDAMMGGEEN